MQARASGATPRVVIDEPTAPQTPFRAAMLVALEEADAAAADGDVPVGAVMVGPAGELVRGRNLRERDRDPTAHAEVVGLRGAARLAGHWRLDGWTCVVTLEPCPMCAGALVNARVARLVYGCRDPKAGAAGSLFTIPSDSRLNHRMEVIEGVEAEACALRLRDFFAARRREGKK